MLSVAGRPVGDGVHVVGGGPPSSLPSLHPHQQDSKRPRLADPHNLPQLRIDTQTKVTTGTTGLLTDENRERESLPRSRSQLQIELTSKDS